MSVIGGEMQEINTVLRIPSAADCIYTSCYCEENVWKLCEYVKNNQKNLLPFCYVVFMSNKDESVPLWSQRSGAKQDDYLAIWDYHVIFIFESSSGSIKTMVYDLDSTLPFPVDLLNYKLRTLKSDCTLSPEYYRMFRVIPAETFLITFASDRSRMKKTDGTWIKLPPPYASIRTAESINNLEDFISMDPEKGVGEVLSLEQFCLKFL